MKIVTGIHALEIRETASLQVKKRADGGTRTRTPVRAGDFKSPVSAIPPHPHDQKSISLAGKRRQGAETDGIGFVQHIVQGNEAEIDRLVPGAVSVLLPDEGAVGVGRFGQQE